MIPKYYEFLNRIKILSGFQALENIPHELKERGSSHPMLIMEKEAEEQGLLKNFLAAIDDPELIIGSICFSAPPITSEALEKTLSEFKSSACDSIIAIGGESSFELGRAVSFLLKQSTEDSILLMDDACTGKNISSPFVIVPTGNSGLEIAGDPDIVVLDPRMAYNLAPRTIILYALDTICHAIESFTCLQKNPLSDAYAFSAINIVRENLADAVKFPRKRAVRHALANAALLSGIAMNNSHAGITHALAYALEENSHVNHQEAVAIILPFCMKANMPKLDEYYGELLLPLKGPEIYADTPKPERGRKTVQALRNTLLEYHLKYDIPICLSGAGVKRSDFDNITTHCLKSSHLLFNSADITEEAVQNILNMSF